ncbi:hypothetical protein ACMA5I_12505 [Paracoccaceae bacterium GXU_MW_L88]
MAVSRDPDDPRGLIREAYRIEGLSLVEARSIFFDWAMGPGAPDDLPEAVRRLHLRYGATAPAHPMSFVLKEGLATPKRRRS